MTFHSILLKFFSLKEVQLLFHCRSESHPKRHSLLLLFLLRIPARQQCDVTQNRNRYFSSFDPGCTCLRHLQASGNPCRELCREDGKLMSCGGVLLQAWDQTLSSQMLLLAPRTVCSWWVTWSRNLHKITVYWLLLLYQSVLEPKHQVLIGFQDAPAWHKMVQSGPRLNLDLLPSLLSYSASLIHLSWKLSLKG